MAHTQKGFIMSTSVRSPLLSSSTQHTLIFLFTCFIGHIIASWLGIPYTWGMSLGIVLSYPYHSSENFGQYLLEVIAVASVVGLEIAAINATGITGWLIKEYRARYVDTQLITAVCIVLLLTPIIDVIVKNVLEPLLLQRIPPTGVKIIATMIFGGAIAILNQYGAISFIVGQCRELNLDAHLVTAICVLFFFTPINNFIGDHVRKVVHV